MIATRLTTNAIDGSLRLLRRPLDLVIGRLPGPVSGPGAAVRIAVDRLDASTRGMLATLLHDDRLTEDARRRQAAADQRERAVELRREGEARQARAQERLEDRREQASDRRQKAARRAAARRQQAERSRQSTSRRAQEVQSERTAAGRRDGERTEQQIGAEESARRLPAVGERAEALQEHQRALAQADEARRLGEAAARVKEERQRG